MGSLTAEAGRGIATVASLSVSFPSRSLAPSPTFSVRVGEVLNLVDNSLEFLDLVQSLIELAREDLDLLLLRLDEFLLFVEVLRAQIARAWLFLVEEVVDLFHVVKALLGLLDSRRKKANIERERETVLPDQRLTAFLYNLYAARAPNTIGYHALLSTPRSGD